MTLKAFSGAVKASAPYLTQIVKGYRKPSASLALRIEQVTGGEVKRMDVLYPETK